MMCVEGGNTYRACNRFPKAHAELMTENIQKQAFTSLQTEKDKVTRLVVVTKTSLIDASTALTRWSSGLRL